MFSLGVVTGCQPLTYAQLDVSRVTNTVRHNQVFFRPDSTKIR